MRKVINGKIYDTENATLLAEDWNGLGSGDFNYFVEELYITKKGSFFLYGSGGALSIYNESNGRETWGISKIIPLTEKETFDWLENNGETEVIEEYFRDWIEEA